MTVIKTDLPVAPFNGLPNCSIFLRPKLNYMFVSLTRKTTSISAILFRPLSAVAFKRTTPKQLIPSWLAIFSISRAFLKTKAEKLSVVSDTTSRTSVYSRTYVVDENCDDEICCEMQILHLENFHLYQRAFSKKPSSFWEKGNFFEEKFWHTRILDSPPPPQCS